MATYKQFPPEGVHGAEFNNSKDTLWFWMEPRKLYVSQVLNTRGAEAVTTVPTNEPMYKFLMPTTYSTSQNHEWDKFESVGVKFNELATEVSHALHNVTSLHATSAKADAPLFYKDSARREWTFEFQFIVHTNAYYDVWLPIQEILRMAAPTNTGSAAFGVGGQIGIEIPYLFSLQTRSGTGKDVPVVSVPEAVITSIQPKYEQPYIGGYPSKAELTITFKDANVLFRDSYKTSGNLEGVNKTIRENGVPLFQPDEGAD
jgi:hypothetical protein